MIRPTHTGCFERKKHETIHSIKATYPQNFVFLALTHPFLYFFGMILCMTFFGILFSDNPRPRPTFIRHWVGTAGGEGNNLAGN